MKRSAFVAWLVLSLLFTGCSGGSGSASDSGATGQPASGTANAKPGGGKDRKLKVALLTPGPVSDAGWSALAYEGLQAIGTELGAEVNNQEAKGSQIKDAMRGYANQGYDLIFGHGYEYNEPGVELSKDFPNTVFVSSSGGKTSPNAGAFRFRLEEAFYLAGTMAGMMTKTNTVAMIGGPDVPSIRSTFKAFRAGAMAAKPGIKVIETFTGQDSDVAAARQATLAAISEKADFVIHQTNAAAQGVFNACKEKSVFAFGANLDQNSNASGVVIASAVIKAKPAFVKLAKQVQDGAFKGGIVFMGMSDGAIEFVLNPALADKTPTEVKSKLEELQRQIVEGRLEVPMLKF